MMNFNLKHHASSAMGVKNVDALKQIGTQSTDAHKLRKFDKAVLYSKNSFTSYNKLLLVILLYWPSKGKFLSSLFEKQSFLSVLPFLDEKSSIPKELKISASRPLLLFLKAQYLYFKKTNGLRYFGAFLLVVTYLFLSKLNHQLGINFSYVIMIIGLLWIGIPHGALDHLLSKNKSTSLFLFVLKYLVIIALYFIFWQFSPSLGLLVFICFSSFHFGESELAETEGNVNSPVAYFKAFLMGLSILIFIIFSHPAESLSIVANFIVLPEQRYSELNFTFVALIGTIFSFVYILVQSLMSERWSYLGLLFLLAIGVKVPLILAFGVYFIFQHSANAWQHLKLGLNMSSIQLYKKSSFYTLGALVIFLLIAFYPNKIVSIDVLWANFFVFIACISFPHFFLMHIFYKAKRH